MTTHSPVPPLSVAIRPKSAADRDRLDAGLRQLIDEDSTLSITTEALADIVTLGARTEPQLETAIDRLKRDFHVNATLGRPEVGYKETFTRVAEGEGRFIGRVAGRARYAHARIRVRPAESGSGVRVETALIGNAIPSTFVEPTIDGIRRALAGGAVSGYPVDDVVVEVYDGSYHDVDSSAAAFNIAGALAVRDAVPRAAPVVLEPFVLVRINAPVDYVDRIITGVAARRGRLESAPGTSPIHARMPLAASFGFPHDVHARTGGRAACVVQFDGYEECRSQPDGGDDDPLSPVREPRRPAPPVRHTAASVAEPEDDNRAAQT